MLSFFVMIAIKLNVVILSRFILKVTPTGKRKTRLQNYRKPAHA